MASLYEAMCLYIAHTLGMLFGFISKHMYITIYMYCTCTCLHPNHFLRGHSKVINISVASLYEAMCLYIAHTLGMLFGFISKHMYITIYMYCTCTCLHPNHFLRGHSKVINISVASLYEAMCLYIACIILILCVIFNELVLSV